MDPHFHGVIFQTHPEELQRRLAHSYPPYLLFDVRDESERAAGTIAGARPLTAEQLGDELPEGATPTTEIFVIGAAQSDPRPRALSRALRERGATRVVELAGGMFEWNAELLPVETASHAA